MGMKRSVARSLAIIDLPPKPANAPTVEALATTDNKNVRSLRISALRPRPTGTEITKIELRPQGDVIVDIPATAASEAAIAK